MSIVNTKGTDGDIVAKSDGNECFFCGRILHYPYVTWMGIDARHINLHPHCVSDLCLRLMRDIGELELCAGHSPTIVNEQWKNVRGHDDQITIFVHRREVAVHEETLNEREVRVLQLQS
jgi:hypothetical protein